MSKETEWVFPGEGKWTHPQDTRTDLEKKRDEMYYNLLRRLNKQHKAFVMMGGLFDCGELGIVDIWFGRHTWEHKWRDVTNAEQFIKDGKR